jgi:elongation factor Ts
LNDIVIRRKYIINKLKLISMAITAADVNKLRKQTGAGMMDCKNALVETDGDFESAVDVLRKKGQKVAAKRGENEAKEGVVFAQATADGKTGVVLALNCETDFVAKNDDFRNFVQSLVDIAIAKLPSSTEELLNAAYNEKLSVNEKIIEQVGVVGEKLDLSGFEVLKAEKVVAYNHPGNQLATLVGLNSGSDVADDAGKQVAMQVAAMNPLSLNKEGIDADTIARELEVGKDLAIQEGKPAEMAVKIAEGRLNKFFKENTLLSQDFVRDSKMSVEQFLSSSEKGLTIVDFKRIALG